MMQIPLSREQGPVPVLRLVVVVVMMLLLLLLLLLLLQLRRHLAQHASC
jgi:hypothetical protein